MAASADASSSLTLRVTIGDTEPRCGAKETGMAKRQKPTGMIVPQTGGYPELVAGISELLERARRTAARSVNSILTATYWEIGRRIVEYEQGGGAGRSMGKS